MGEFDLLTAVQPEGGWYAIVGIKGDSRHQVLVDTREEFDGWVEHFIKQKRNVFFGVAKYATDESRKKSNVQALKAFWMDIDCGPGKDYPDQREALAALQQFCKTVGLPRPAIVNSGRGLHVYWALEAPICREQWEHTAARLKEVCTAQGLRVDPTCFEVARILRVPGTFNFKGETPVPVEVISTGRVVTYADMCELLGTEQPTIAPRIERPERRVSALGQMLQNNIESSFTKIMKRGETGCAQLYSCFRERAELSEPRWFNALSVAKFCSDRDKAIHKLSADHPDYDPGRTEQKIEHIVGPHTCDQFESNNPGVCAGCPHLGKIKSPIMLGRELVEATEEDSIVEEEAPDGTSVTYKVPEYPFPYQRGKHGGIYLRPVDDETLPTLVYAHDLYVVKRMEDPAEGGVVLIRHHTPRDGVREFVIPNHKVMDGAELRKALAAKNVMATEKQFKCIVDFIIKSFSVLFTDTEAEQMRNQFGWADNDSKFIIGDRELSVDGTFHSPPSSATKALADYMVPSGSFEKWKEVFDLYGLPGMEPFAFAAATAFGAPLLRFSGQRGAIINLVNTSSGTGKTTTLHMCNSVWGNPEKLCAKKDDTFNSKVFKIGVLCNLPSTFDEMSNTDPKQLSELTYLITQGTGKDRMKASSNEMRVNLTSWQTIALCSSNHSFYEKLELLKNTPQGEMMRIIEYSLDYSSAIDTELGKQMFDHQLMENYGFAGDIYARYLITHYDEVRDLYNTVQNRLDTHLKLTQRERFWSATVAANITGIHVAISLGLCNWNLASIFKWACKMILGLRKTTTPPPEGEKQIIGEFIIGRIDNILAVNEGIDRRSKMQEVPIMEPRRELMIRFEPDTERLFVTCAAFKQYCAARNIGYRETLNKLKASGLFLKSGQKRMGKGMKWNLPPVQALEFDASHPDLAMMNELIPEQKATEDASSGG